MPPCFPGRALVRVGYHWLHPTGYATEFILAAPSADRILLAPPIRGYATVFIAGRAPVWSGYYWLCHFVYLSRAPLRVSFPLAPPIRGYATAFILGHAPVRAGYHWPAFKAVPPYYSSCALYGLAASCSAHQGLCHHVYF